MVCLRDKKDNRKELIDMNSAKRVSTQTIKQNNNVKEIPAENVSKMTIITFALVAITIILVIAMVLWENLHPRVIFTVNGDKVYLSDMMADIYTTESTGQYMDQLYKQNYGATSRRNSTKSKRPSREHSQKRKRRSRIRSKKSATQ